MIYNSMEQNEIYHLYYMESDIERQYRELELAEEATKLTREVEDE